MKLSPSVKRKEFERIRELINLLITTHPAGFNILLGACPPPTTREVYEMMNSKRSPLPVDFRATQKSNVTQAEIIFMDNEYFNEAVEMAGGWVHINQASHEFMKIDPRMWKIAEDHVKYVANATSRFESRLDYIARKHGVSRNTATKYRRLFADVLSMIILIPDGEKFELVRE